MKELEISRSVEITAASKDNCNTGISVILKENLEIDEIQFVEGLKKKSQHYRVQRRKVKVPKCIHAI